LRNIAAKYIYNYILPDTYFKKKKSEINEEGIFVVFLHPLPFKKGKMNNDVTAVMD
jgi:alpha/beta superfamily hydrolase